MSEPYLYEAQEAFYEDYKEWCKENDVPATLDGFDIWLSDGDFDTPEPYTLEPS